MERMAVLESALKARNELIASASHDLRTPIIHILSSAQHLESEPLETRQRDCVAQILASGTHVMALIERILTISDLRAGELELFEPGTLGPQRPGAA